MVNPEDNTSIKIHKHSNHFSATHFLSTKNFIEGLHGHNYYFEVELYGKLSSDDLVYDFISLDKSLKEFTSEWDHLTLLPRHNKRMKLKENGANVDIQYGDRFYSIPQCEVKFLECKNVTTEILTRILAKKIVILLGHEGKNDNLTKVKVVIWETPLYSASHTIHLEDH